MPLLCLDCYTVQAWTGRIDLRNLPFRTRWRIRVIGQSTITGEFLNREQQELPVRGPEPERGFRALTRRERYRAPRVLSLVENRQLLLAPPLHAEEPRPEHGVRGHHDTPVLELAPRALLGVVDADRPRASDGEARPPSHHVELALEAAGEASPPREPEALYRSPLARVGVVCLGATDDVASGSVPTDGVDHSINFGAGEVPTSLVHIP